MAGSTLNALYQECQGVVRCCLKQHTSLLGDGDNRVLERMWARREEDEQREFDDGDRLLGVKLSQQMGRLSIKEVGWKEDSQQEVEMGWAIQEMGQGMSQEIGQEMGCEIGLRLAKTLARSHHY